MSPAVDLRDDDGVFGFGADCPPEHRVVDWEIRPRARVVDIDEWRSRRTEVKESHSTRATSAPNSRHEGRTGGLREAIEASSYIYRLKDDWDGEGSHGYRRETWRRAIEFLRLHSQAMLRSTGKELPAPTIGPGPDSGIDLYWKAESFELLVVVPDEASEPAEFYGDDYGKQTIKGTLSTSEITPGLLHWLIKW